MRLLLLTTLIMFISFVQAQTTVDWDDLEKRGEIYYLKETGEPFSGLAVAKSEEDERVILLESPFKDGKRHGAYKQSNLEGKLTMQTVYKDGLRDGLEIYTYNNAMASIRTKRYYKDGLFHGSYKEWFESGALQRESTWVNGKKEGSEKYFYEDSSLKSECNYVNGVYNGRQQQHYPNGQLSNKYYYINGLQQDSLKEYYQNGNLKLEAYYAEGKIIGIKKEI